MSHHCSGCCAGIGWSYCIFLFHGPMCKQAKPYKWCSIINRARLPLDTEQCLFRRKGYCISWKTLALDWQSLPARENEPFLGTRAPQGDLAQHRDLTHRYLSPGSLALCDFVLKLSRCKSNRETNAFFCFHLHLLVLTAKGKVSCCCTVFLPPVVKANWNHKDFPISSRF